MSDSTNWQAIGLIVGLLLTILGFLWKFNNNVVKAQVALTSVVSQVAVLEVKTESHGHKISELVGGFNARAKAGDILEPLSYSVKVL